MTGAVDAAPAAELTDHADATRTPRLAAGQTSFLTLRDGARVRIARFPAADASPRAHILIMPGYSEFIEKYLEVIDDLLQRGFAVVCFDWRGQGLSTRAHPLRRGWVLDFDQYLDDVEEIVAFCDLAAPLIGLGHSMGGHLLIRTLQRNRLPFKAAAVTAPMQGLKGLPTPLARAVAWLADTLGFGERYAGTATDTDPHGPHQPLSSDPARIERWRGYLRADKQLITHPVTYHWIRVAARSMAQSMRTELGAQIRTPLLIVNPSADTLVEPKAARRFTANCDAATLAEVPTSEHEILHEVDSLRDAFWRHFDAFVDGVLEAPTTGG
ncbi:MAG: alpha/beta hydrolase [Pseudomonadota bacterium]